MPVGEAVVASCPTLNRWFAVEYGSPPAYMSVITSYSHCLVSLSSPQARARMRRAVTATSPPTAVGTSPTVPRGAPRSPRVRARRRAVGPNRWLSFVHTPAPPTESRDRSPGLILAIGTVTEISVRSGVHAVPGVKLSDKDFCECATLLTCAPSSNPRTFSIEPNCYRDIDV